MRTVRKGDQQLPSTGRVDVGPAVVTDVRLQRDFRDPRVIEAVAVDFEERIQLGIERYGHPLQTHNGRDAALDAYQELLDTSHYLKQLYIEQHNAQVRLMYMVVVGLVLDLKEWIVQRESGGRPEAGAR